MAITVAKVTYSLKPETVGKVEELAVKWGVPKSEVIHRAVIKAALDEDLPKSPNPLQALDWLQKNGITPAAAEKFNAELRRQRRASDRRRK
jgi:hypothetical protein